MKKYIKYLFYTLVAVTLFSAWGCSNDDDDKYTEQEILVSQLPQAAQTFISQAFADDTPTRIIKDIENGTTWYDVYLTSGTKIEFDQAGDWHEVEVPAGKSLSLAIIQPNIATYVEQNYPGVGVHSISIDPEGFEVELNNSLDLIFNQMGDFVRIDK